MPRKKKTDDGQTTDGTQSTTTGSSSTQQNNQNDIIIETTDIDQTNSELEIDLSLPQEEKVEEITLDIGEIQIEEIKPITENISDLGDVLMEETYQKLDGTYGLNEDFSFDLSIEEDNESSQKANMTIEETKAITEDIALESTKSDDIGEISLSIDENKIVSNDNSIVSEVSFDMQNNITTNNDFQLTEDDSNISFETISPSVSEIYTEESTIVGTEEIISNEEVQTISYNIEDQIIAQESSDINNISREEIQIEPSGISMDNDLTQSIDTKDEDIQNTMAFDLDSIDTVTTSKIEPVVELDNIAVPQTQNTTTDQTNSFDLYSITASQISSLENKIEKIEAQNVQEQISTIDTSNLVNNTPKSSKKGIFVGFISILGIILLGGVGLGVYVVMYPDNNIFNTKSQNIEIPESLITSDNTHSAAEANSDEKSNVEVINDEDTQVTTGDNSIEEATTSSGENEQLSGDSVDTNNQEKNDTQQSTGDTVSEENTNAEQQEENLTGNDIQTTTNNSEESELSSGDVNDFIIDEEKKSSIKELALKAKKIYLSAKQLDNKDAMKYSLIVYKNAKKIYDSIINNETLDPTKLEGNIKTLETYLEKADKLLNE